jgi:hypothetical protein
MTAAHARAEQPGEPAPALDRMANVRDTGGLTVEGGGTIRSGVLYRSDQPLPGDQMPDLDPWPPAAIVDLRSAHELRTPHPLAGVTPTILSLAVMDEAEPARVGIAPGQPDIARLHGRLYARMLEQSGRQFATIAAMVAQAPGPTLVHCAAGKDRTGIICALTHHLAGVRDDDIQQDYLLTNDPDRLAQRLPMIRQVIRESTGRTASDEALMTAMRVEAEYLAESFAAMREESGSLNGYLETALGLDGDLRARLHARLLG